MSGVGGTQRSSGNGFFVENGNAAKAGNEALAKGFGLAEAAAEARNKTGIGPGPYFAGTRKEYADQQKPMGIAKTSEAYRSGRSAAVSASNRTRWKNLIKKTGTTKGGPGFKDKGV